MRRLLLVVVLAAVAALVAPMGVAQASTLPADCSLTPGRLSVASGANGSLRVSVGSFGMVCESGQGNGYRITSTATTQRYWVSSKVWRTQATSIPFTGWNASSPRSAGWGLVACSPRGALIRATETITVKNYDMTKTLWSQTWVGTYTALCR